MQNTLLFALFAAVWLGNLQVGRASWRYHRSAAWPMVAWFVAASFAGLAVLLNGALRLPSWGVPTAVVALFAAYGAWMWRSSRAAASDWLAALKLQRWRAYFGALILLGGALGLLPWAFALPAGLGDVAVGLWAAYLARGKSAAQPPARPTVLAFTALGVADLINAGRLGGLVVVPWLAAQQLPTFVLMLPMFGVPIMLVAHVWLVRGVFAQRPGSSQRVTGVLLNQ